MAIGLYGFGFCLDNKYREPWKKVSRVSDVYSFGVIFAQLILKGEELEKIPPVLGRDVALEFREICENCWKKDEEGRFDFKQFIGTKVDERTITSKTAKLLDAHMLLNQQLEELQFEKFWHGVVQQELGFDPLGKLVWESVGLFGHETAVEEDFFFAMQEVVGIREEMTEGPGWKAFRQLLSLDNGGIVTLPKFVQCLQWFGPLNATSFFDRITQMTQNQWFHGKMDRTEAEKLLAKVGKDGAWMVRFGSVPGTYTLGVLKKKKNTGWTVGHFRISRDADGFTVDGESHFGTINDLIKNHVTMSKAVLSEKFVFQKLGKLDRSTAEFDVDTLGAGN